jgi:hypothetical protein
MPIYSDTHRLKNISKYTNHKTECLHVTAPDTVNTACMGSKLSNKTEQAENTG